MSALQYKSSWDIFYGIEGALELNLKHWAPASEACSKCKEITLWGHFASISPFGCVPLCSHCFHIHRVREHKTNSSVKGSGHWLGRANTGLQHIFGGESIQGNGYPHPPALAETTSHEGSVSSCPFLPSHHVCIPLLSSASSKNSVASAATPQWGSKELTVPSCLCPASCLHPYSITIFLCLWHLA